MATLTNTKIKDTYDGLLKTADNDVIGASEKNITDGLGNATVLSIGTASASFSNSVSITGSLNASVAVTAGTISVGDAIVHTGDIDTKIEFLSNQIKTTVGGTLAINTIATGTEFYQDAVINEVVVGRGAANIIQNTTLGRNANGGTGIGTAIGYFSLYQSTGNYNTGVGLSALKSNTTGGYNTSVGAFSSEKNTTGSQNTSVGSDSLRENTTGGSNTAVGYNSLGLNTTGLYNSALGVSALGANLTGSGNVAIGYFSLRNSTASYNTAIGFQSMADNTTGGGNTAIGAEALNLNTTGSNSTAVGRKAMSNATAGNNNTAVGFYSLVENEGSLNVAIGDYALRYNTTGTSNSALGSAALRDNTTGIKNTAVGQSALANNLTSDSNTAVGYRALYISQGAYNTAIGSNALDNNTTGGFNSAMGYGSLGNNSSGSYNISIGVNSLLSNTDGDRNVALGYGAGDSKTSGDGNIYIGHSADGANATTSNEIVIGQNAVGNGSDTATYGNGDITDHYFTAGNVHIVGDLTVGGTMPSSDLDLTGTPYGEGDILTVSSSGTLTKIDKDTAAEYLGVNSKTLMKDLSFGESYVNNFRSRVIDNTGTYFPTPSGYNFGVMKNKGLVEKMGVMLLPSGVKSGGLFSVKPSNGNGDFDFTRASTATYVDEDGLIAVAPTGTPRLDYPLIDGVVQETPSLLLEPSRTNELTYSEDFSNGYWIKSRASITSTSTINPSGSASSSYIYDDNTNGTHKIYSGTFSVTSGQNQSVSIFAKAGTLSTFRIKFARFDEADIGFTEVIFDLENGTSSSAEGTIIDYGNGWYRCIITDTVNYTGLARVFLYLKDGVYTGTGTDYIEIWGVQAETNASYATSYIPTAGSTVTRSAETCNGAGTSADFNDSEGVLFAEMSALADDLTGRFISINDGSGSDRITIGFSTTSNLIFGNCHDGGASQGFLSITTDTVNSNKIAYKYKQNDFALWFNGFEIGTDTSGTTPTGLNELSFDNGSAGNTFEGNTKQLITFKQALTDAELEDLTSWDTFNEMATAQNYQTI